MQWETQSEAQTQQMFNTVFFTLNLPTRQHFFRLPGKTGQKG